MSLKGDIMLPKHFAREYTSQANSENTVVCGEHRFTVLTDSLIRLEHCRDGYFENRATQSVINRRLGKVAFSVQKSDDLVKLETEKLTLTFIPSLGFSAEGLNIQVKNVEGAVWRFGDEQHTLKGTYRTLDGIFVERSVELGEGVCSREGFALLDDSKSLAVLPDGWVEPRQENITDIYFFGYGHDYVGATKSLYKLTGNPPLLPSYVFGNWWSRFKRYNEESYTQLMTRFKEEDLPFSVAVIDMDWHLYDNNPAWWTGYTWNEELFPDYKRFLDWLHRNGLHTALNLHPAKGVQCHEAMYEKMAKARGIDPETKETAEFKPCDRDFWEPYFEILHRPYEKDGVDFWWMDWQQGTETDIKGLDPLWILNHFHSLDKENRNDRPMYFSRFSGAGSQRFYVGFSGDAYINWDAYAFEPYFTATSANIGFPYWSHDIGGFQHGVRDDELYTRWVQFGVFSPILRLHSTNYDFVCKEPWNYGAEAEREVGEALRLRHKLFPYLYTMNYRTHTENEALCQPLYYFYPEQDCAYKYKNEYFFGSELLVAPVTEKTDSKTKLAKTELWLPEGKWTDFFTGLTYEGDRELSVYRNIRKMPVFLKSGAILPMNCHIKGDNTVGSKENMEICLCGGASNSFTLYEDEGINNRYLNGHFVKTEMTLEWMENKAVFTLNKAEGDISLIPQNRNYKINLFGFAKDIKILVDGKSVNTSYDEETNITSIDLSNISVTSTAVIEIFAEKSLLSTNENWDKQCFSIMLAAETSSWDKKRIFDIITDKNISFEKRLERLETFKDIDENLIEPIKEIFIRSAFRKGDN